jgi:hypothetical protein
MACSLNGQPYFVGLRGWPLIDASQGSRTGLLRRRPMGSRTLSADSAASAYGLAAIVLMQVKAD